MERKYVREGGIHRKHTPVNPEQRKGAARTTETKTERQRLEIQEHITEEPKTSHGDVDWNRGKNRL